MMPHQIPGYYYDEEKKKYFKIQKNHAATSSSAYTAAAVQQRLESHAAKQAARKRAELVKNHIKRHPSGRDVVYSGLLARESALARGGEGIRAVYEDGDIVAAAWARGVVKKGRVALTLGGGGRPNLGAFYVGGEETGCGVGTAYAAFEGDVLMASHVPTNSNDEISFSRRARGISRTPDSFSQEAIPCPQISSINYHAPSGQMLLTSGSPSHTCGLWLFTPPREEEEDVGGGMGHWVPGMTERFRVLNLHHSHRSNSTSWFVNTAAPAPASSDLICVLGASDGIVEVRDDQTMRWTVHHNPASYSSSSSAASSSSRRRSSNSARRNTHSPRNIFATAFQNNSHPNVVFAAGRSSNIWTADLRGPETQWTRFRHATAGVAHLRSVDEHRLLVSGLQHSMALYDTRYIRATSISETTTSSSSSDVARPLLIFPAHRNDAHLHIGFDVSPRLGVVAAAQDDGVVRLFSLRSGRQVQSPQVDALASTAPLKALQFAQLPHERLPSLFVGQGASIRKFSFGVEDVDEES